MFWRFQQISSFFVKRSRTESRKNATSRSNFDKYLDYLASEDRKKILIKSALSLNNFNHPAYADALKTSVKSGFEINLFEQGLRFGSVGTVYATDMRLFLNQKSRGTNFDVHSMQRIEKTWKKKSESFSGTSF